MNINYYKYQGAGNDFILLDNRENIYSGITSEKVKFLCHRRFGVGADGLMMLNNKDDYDFEMKYFNSDGKEGSMCGNGGRCILKFALFLGIKKTKYYFIAADGKHEGEIDFSGDVRLKMKDVSGVEFSYTHYVLDTGSPHYVKAVSDVSQIDVVSEGRSIRNSREFAEEGINVNFVETIDDDTIFVRTYERGVEDETMSCGTGVTASALVSAHNDRGFNRVEVKTMGGKLSVEFEKISDKEFKNIWLVGPAEFVFKGEINLKN
ncbi:MAG: diaminopimelate epimerase [Bacteroidota bacterium]|nr:diaminopimelate epimerase [Bacteroidota bacterium]